MEPVLFPVLRPVILGVFEHPFAGGGTAPVDPVQVTGTLPPWQVGVPVTGTLTITGGTPPYTPALTGLPDGVTWALTGDTVTFSGTPTATGSGSVTVTVEGEDFSFPYTVAPEAIAITGSFPDWVVGQPATGALTISGGTPPYGDLTITSGALPDGVTLSVVGNQIVPSGSPTVAGPWSATVQVSDAAATSASTVAAGDIDPPDMTPIHWSTPGVFSYTPLVSQLRVLVVAGGGGGGRGGATNASGSGGGAGGVVEQVINVIPGVPVVVTVGAGGAGGSILTTNAGVNGEDSVFDSITAVGGGGGGYAASTAGAGTPGSDGGSGGGGGSATSAPGAGVSGQGHAGGHSNTAWQRGGGGGGAGQSGAAATGGGNGGDGVYLLAFAPWYSGTFGGGGGSGVASSGPTAPGTGGTGGGGAGGNATAGVAGTDGTGGGGGGGGTGNSPGGRGGNGSVTVIPL